MEEITVYPSPTATFNGSSSDELTIHVPVSYHHPSPMSEAAKEKARADAPSLVEMFAHTMEQKKEFRSAQAHWINETEVEISESVYQCAAQFHFTSGGVGQNHHLPKKPHCNNL